MNPIVFALRHPYTILVGMLALVLGSGLALSRMRIDIFPSLNLPVIYVAQPYSGLDPAQMEGLITNYYEYHFLYISGIHHVESKNVQGSALMKLYFHPETNMAQAMAETVQYVNRARAFMPPGTVGPFCMRFDTGSVPVGYLVLSSKTKTIGEIQDQALFKVRLEVPPYQINSPEQIGLLPISNPEKKQVLLRAIADIQARKVVGESMTAAIGTEGDVNVGYQTFCYLVVEGHLKRTPIEVGARNERLVEVLKMRVPGQNGEEPRWEAFTGKETVVQGELSGLRDGQAVSVSRKP